MFLPSRPMIRPFRSSEASCTTETVVSAVWPEAVRWMATERMFRARLSDSSRASSSMRRTSFAMSARHSSSTFVIRASRPWAAVMPATFSSSATWASRATFSSSWSCLAWTSRSEIDWSRRARSSSVDSSWPWFAARRSSILMISARRSARSRSCSVRCASSSSRAVTRASFTWASAWRRASSRIRSASRSASPIRPRRRPCSSRTPAHAPPARASAISNGSIASPYVRAARWRRGSDQSADPAAAVHRGVPRLAPPPQAAKVERELIEDAYRYMQPTLEQEKERRRRRGRTRAGS